MTQGRELQISFGNRGEKSMKKTIITLIVVVGIAALVAGGLAIKKYHDIVTPDNILAGLLKEYEITFGDAGVKVLDEYNENAFMDPSTVYRFSLEGGDISGTVLDPDESLYYAVWIG